VEFSDGAMTGNTFSRPSGGFTPSDTGKTFVVVGALGALVDPLVAIGTYVSPTSMTLSIAATTPVVGAVGAYGTNNTAAFLAALADCRFRNYGALLIPAGMWLVGGAALQIFSRSHVYGMGRASVLYAANYTDSGFYATGVDQVSISNLSFKSHAKVRGSRSTTAVAWMLNCTRISLRDLYIDGSKSAGLIIDGCIGGEVENIEVSNTLADGVHLVGSQANGTKRFRVRGVSGYRTGDDTVSVVSYLTGGFQQCDDIHVSNTVSIDNVGGRGLSSVGSTNVTFDGFRVVNPASHGVICAYESEIVGVRLGTHVPHGCRILNGVIEQVDAAPGFNAILIASEDSGHVIDDVTVQNVVVKSSNQSLVAYASNVRFDNITIQDGIYNGIAVDHCTDIEINGSKFKTIQGVGIAFNFVTGGKVENNTFTECQTFDEFGLGASQGRIHMIESIDIYGGGNRDKRTSTTPSYGPILVSGGARVNIGVTEIIPAASDTNYRMKGMEFTSQHPSGTTRDQLFIGTNRPVNPDRYAIVTERGVYVNAGDIAIDGVGKFLGSGGAAWLNLFSGFMQGVSASSIYMSINHTDASPSNTFVVTTGSGEVLVLQVTTAGDVYAKAGFRPSGTSSGHGFFAITGGSPEGVITAPAGSFCLRDLGALGVSGPDGPAYYKATGSGNTGWLPVNLGTEIPSVATHAKEALRVNDGGTGFGWSKVPLDDPAAISLASISSNRYLFHSTGGQIIQKGPADIWADISAIVNANAQLASTAQVTGLDTALAGKATAGAATTSAGTPSHAHTQT
jgi:hypothetical protein